MADQQTFETASFNESVSLCEFSQNSQILRERSEPQNPETAIVKVIYKSLDNNQKQRCITANVQPISEPAREPETQTEPEIKPEKKPYIFDKNHFVFGYQDQPTNLDCGKIRSKIICVDDPLHRPIFKHFRCNWPGCPICYPKFISRIADAVTERVMGYHSVYPKDPIYHLIFWPDSLTGYTNLAEAMQDANFMIEKMGVKSAVVWFHPYRIKNEIKEKLRRYRRENGLVDVGFWKMAHDDVLNLGGLSAYIVEGPHFHAVTSGYLKNTSDYSKLNIGGYKKKGYLASEAAIHRLAYYISSHACFETKKSTVRYFGKISYSKLARRLVREFIEDVVCEICGGSLIEHYCYENGELGNVLHKRVTQKIQIFGYWERGKNPPLHFEQYQQTITSD